MEVSGSSLLLAIFVFISLVTVNKQARDQDCFALAVSTSLITISGFFHLGNHH